MKTEEIDGMIQMCCAMPTDHTRRLVLADALAEAGETACEEALRSKDGEQVIRTVWAASDRATISPSLRVLWAVVVFKVGVPVTVDWPKESAASEQELQDALDRMRRISRPWRSVPAMPTPQDPIVRLPWETRTILCDNTNGNT